MLESSPLRAHFQKHSLTERPHSRRYTRPMKIQLAPAALERIKGYLAETPGAVGLRFGVKRTGCSGWGYVVDLARETRLDDTVSEQDGIRIHVDADSLALVDGTEIDFLKQGLNEQFVFRNPNVAAECGCGESFTTEADRAA
jgi:iron-sulfur cluster assembly protein